MKTFDFGRYVLGGLSIATMVAGCGGSQPPIGAPGAMLQGTVIATHAGRGGSWMLPEAGSDSLLYVANNYNVTVYSYPRGKLVATLKHHFQRPATECADKSGNVYITDGDDVFVYGHGEKKPFRTLTYPGALTTGCGSDPTTGNLSVAFEFGFSKAYIAVYKDAKGTPTLYQYSNLIFARCGYDAAGNLYADGTYGSGQEFGLVKLPKGGSKLKLITLDQDFQNPGPIQWDGKYITVGDNQAEVIYRFSISGSHGTLVSATNLAGASDTMINWWIESDKVIGADTSDQPAVYYWNYPAGGNPVKSITKGLLYPAGTTISNASRPYTKRGAYQP